MHDPTVSSQSILAFALMVVCVAVSQTPAQTQRVFLVSREDTLFRVRGTSIEVFPNMPGASIIGMTIIPAGASVTGASEGEVLAVEGGGTSKIWRLDNPVSGTPTLVQIGSIPQSRTRNSITFAHSRLFFAHQGVIHEHDVNDFSLVASIDLGLGTEGVGGGLAYDTASNWYIGHQQADYIIRLSDPPSFNGGESIGDAGVDIGNHGLEFFDGMLWGASIIGDRLVIGTFDLTTGAFVQEIDVAPAPAQRSVGLTIIEVCAADLNDDDSLDFFDLSAFLNFYATGDFLADFTADGLLDFFDVQHFLNNYAAGCP